MSKHQGYLSLTQDVFGHPTWYIYKISDFLGKEAVLV